MENEFKYSNDQIASIYAKLEVAKILSNLSTEMAKQAETEIKFYRITNSEIEPDDE